MKKMVRLMKPYLTYFLHSDYHSPAGVGGVMLVTIDLLKSVIFYSIFMECRRDSPRDSKRDSVQTMYAQAIVQCGFSATARCTTNQKVVGSNPAGLIQWKPALRKALRVLLCRRRGGFFAFGGTVWEKRYAGSPGDALRGPGGVRAPGDLPDGNRHDNARRL